MHHRSVLSPLIVLASLARAAAYEAADFNVIDALEHSGINTTLLHSLYGPSSAARAETFGCSIACSVLSVSFGTEAVTSQGEPDYERFIGSYWSLHQAEVSPYCIFMPPSPSAVSVAVLLSRLTRCRFAVKSGGHAAFANSSSAEGGITISLEKLTAVDLPSDRQEVIIQPGNRWVDVYKKLDSQGLTVTGGRVSSVGTGGLTLGGGISFFSNIYGWACDNVVGYQVVTATGSIIDATTESYPDLFWALRGGGNNFGIVTSFTFETINFPEGRMWGGSRTFLEDSFDGVTNAFAELIANSPQDPKAGTWVAWLKLNGTKLAVNELWYTEPGGADAPIFDGFNSLAPVADSTQDRVLHEYTLSLDESNPSGLREMYSAMTVKANPEIAKMAREIFFEELPAVDGVAGANPVLIFQGITLGQIKNMGKNGGNPLGLSPGDGPLYLIHISAWWEQESDDKLMYSFASRVLTRINREATALGVANDYVYMNYASAFQNVIASYGSEKVAKLKRIAALYDPTGVFQELQPGYFKLDRAAVPDSGYFHLS